MVMSRFLNFIKINIYPIFGITVNDLESDLSKKLFFFTTTALAIIFGIFFLHSLSIGVYDLSLIQFLTAATAIGAWIVFIKTGSLNIAASIILSLSLIYSILSIYWMGGFNAPVFFTLATVPLFTAAIMPISFSLFWTTIYCLIMVGFYLLKVYGIQINSNVSPESIDKIRIFAMIITQFVILLVINYIRSVNKKYREIMDREKNQKTNLVRVLSHDIATPVTVLKTCLRRIEKQIPADSTDYKRMVHSIKVITNILEHVRELEAVSSGKKEIVLQKVNMLEIFDELKQLHQQSIEAKGITFKVEYRDLGGHFLVLADRRGLSYQVLNNLISNAIKFTEFSGTILVLLESTPSHTTCTIKDSGVGMPKELVEQIFSETATTTRPGTHGEKGTGFGMPIVKNYIERFQGKIEIQSSLKEVNIEDHGTTVTITLPNAS